MPCTPREIVTKALKFQTPERLPIDLWVLPWAERHHGAELAALQERYPADIVVAPDVASPSPRLQGDQYGVGEYTDEWGCVFTNVQEGVIGEVRKPMVRELSDAALVAPPYETFPENEVKAKDAVNAWCGSTDKFVRAACCPRPWERYQFLRGTEHSLTDILLLEPETLALLGAIHHYYLRELEFWAATDVDALFFMDDWGSQQQLLIPPTVWREIFKPMYREYCEVAHSCGKFAFMHSDGNIQEIYPDLIDVGVDALNSQLFCMDMAEIARVAKGKITFWGEIDRQHVLPSLDPSAGEAAVQKVARHLYDPAGGIIAQFECGPGFHPPTAMRIMQTWDSIAKHSHPIITENS